MFTLTGILKKEEIREFVRKDGSEGKSKILYIEPEGSVYPVKVSVADANYKAGKIGEKVSLNISVYSYHIVDKKRKRAFSDYYIPTKK